MKIITFLTALFTLVLILSFRNDKPAYVIFNMEGKDIKYMQMIKKLASADIILFGEEHSNPIAHWMELNIAKDLKEEGESLVLGAEMFEADNQLVLDEYLNGHILESNFEKDTRLWNNYDTDYKPLVNFSLENHLKFIATNIPRRYAAIVSRKGFSGLDSISGRAKEFIAPLPVSYDADLPGYRSMRDMMGSHGHGGGISNPDFFSQAQAIKDATMAYFINKNFSRGQCFIHFNGSYHSNNFEGISWYLRKLNPGLEILTINVVEQEDPGTLSDENRNTADFIISTPADMTKTF